MARALSIRVLSISLVSLAVGLMAACATAPPRTDPGIDPPASPSGLNVVLHPEGTLVLEWRDNSVDETSFVVVEDCGESVGWVGSVARDQTRVAIEGATAGTTCSFVVFAANGGGLSGPSNVATIGSVSATLPDKTSPGPSI
ncbi:MAG: fibronectin type III domain-containing protein [Gemmatimonadota bacterium]|nr:fibronectin type III domain-containing protein [Gemmatimonadota bacterium]